MGRILVVTCDGCCKDVSVNLHTSQIKPEGETEPLEIRCGSRILGELCGTCQVKLAGLLETHTLGR